MASENNVLLDVKRLKKYFPVRKGVLRKTVAHVRAVDGVDFFIREGETLGLVGESGCGKTTTGRVILRLLEPTEGEIHFRTDGRMVEITDLNYQEMKKLRREIQAIFQDPYSSLDPRMTIKDIVGEPIVVNRIARGRDLEERVRLVLEAVGLRAGYMRRFPHEFSGGQRQRIGIARALAVNPKLVIADEPVSALDVSIQAQVLNLMEELQEEFGLTYLFIAHDLSVVEHVSNRVAVMYLGKIVEMGGSEGIYEAPKHPYTEALISAVPTIGATRRSKRRIILRGDVPDPVNPPPGCNFHPRCRYTEDICRKEDPPLRSVSVDGGSRYVACHFADELKLRGIEE